MSNKRGEEDTRTQGDLEMMEMRKGRIRGNMRRQKQRKWGETAG